MHVSTSSHSMPRAATGTGAATATDRYPVELIDVWHLTDGRRVLVRPMLPQDGPLFDAFVRRLAPHTRYQRFHAPLAALPADSLARLTRVDHRDHVALIASVFDEAGETEIAEVRYALDGTAQAGTGGEAEFAIAVADDWQGRGVGGRMLRAIVRAAGAAGLARLRGDILGDNAAMLALARSNGARIRRHPTDGWLLRAEIAAAEAPVATPRAATSPVR
jgi:acetyltransferase